MTAGMRRGWQAATAIMFAVSLFALWQSLQIKLVDRLGPGSGFFPFGLALLGLLFSAVLFVRATRAPVVAGDGETIFPRGAAAWRAIGIVALAGAATALLEPLGFQLAVLLFVALLLALLGERKWQAALLAGVVAGFGVYHVFTKWLDVLLPAGPFAP